MRRATKGGISAANPKSPSLIVSSVLLALSDRLTGEAKAARAAGAEEPAKGKA